MQFVVFRFCAPCVSISAAFVALLSPEEEGGAFRRDELTGWGEVSRRSSRS